MTTRLQMHLYARDLKNLSGIMGKSDPFAVVTVRGDNVNNKPHVIGQTDVIFNNLNPSWSRVIFLEGYKFGVPYHFEIGVFDFDASRTGKTEQELSRMDIYSQTVITGSTTAQDSKRSDMLRNGKFPHKVMGTALFEVGQILAARGNLGSKSLQTGGALYVHIERCTTSTSNESARMRLQLRGLKLTNYQSLGRTSSPYYELYRKVERPTGATWISVYRSSVIRSDLNPLWSEVSLDMEAVCNADLDRAMKVIVWDHRKTGKHKQMGEFETTMRGMVEACEGAAEAEVNNTSTEDFGFTLTKLDHKVGTVQVVCAALSQPTSTANLSASYSQLSLGNGDLGGSTRGGLGSSSVAGGGAGGGGGSAAENVAPQSPRQQRNVASAGGVEHGSPKSHKNNHHHHHHHQQQQHHGGGGGGSLGGRGSAHGNNSFRTAGRPEFVDYLSGGCQISLACAIDFTASNGDPRQPGTPHYFHPPESKEWNDYEKAIFAVGSILAKYDSDQRFPVWGFGAKYNNVVRHCFQCGSEVEVDGVQGIMDAYRGVFRTPLTMSYPTKFTEVIQTAASYARHEQEVAEDEGKQSYTILLILSAGNVENVKETKNQLIEASEDPLSVVIVGIGDADFGGMEFLDEHDPMTEGGRDITKFVRFSDYKSFNALTEAVLDEIPDQLVTYFFERNILPGQLEAIGEGDVEVEKADDEDRTLTFLG